MKKYGLYLMMTAAISLAAISCSSDGDDYLDEWMVANQQVFNAIKTNPEYKELKSPGNESSIYYKVLQKGEGKDSIYYTSVVSCYYKGMFAADYPQNDIKKGDVFDRRLYDDGTPYSFTVGTSVINGWKTALYGMVRGDKWEVWIPYQLAYGRSGSSSIPGYSTLVFEIEIVSIDGK
jgi:peptidylprolyl isomerase/FKBP-type peptidyl-prolyl cis-trans isomerase FklB